MSNWWLNDDAVDSHYARNYYGPGTDYFDPPEYEDDEDEEWDEDYEYEESDEM